ncbi:PREDICTED: tubulin--tyrosine ligase-like protein 12 [Acropora digitifera]|uniref:tubulin--tyrosine ligase-like protein 12 n=1 Tax=Acropora digitifera TaxID=70779 RepID=UPI00077A7B1D|nr:PREDICTED: tubulin--tyrosine ligase-like protein 12 [Acropora digitifera]
MADELEYTQFVSMHQGQLTATQIPQYFWRTLHAKLKNETYDAGSYFTLARSEDGDLRVFVTREEGIETSDPNCVFLIDHAWTYEVNYAREQLKTIPGLADRMALLMGLASTDEDVSETSREELTEKIFDKMWSFNQNYHLKVVAAGITRNENHDRSTSGDEEHTPLWYIMDEFGSCIKHSDDPSFAVAMLFYVPLGVSFSIMWPLRDMAYGEEATRNYVKGVEDPLVRDCCLLPWFPDKLTDEEWIKQLSTETTMESARSQLREIHLKDVQGERHPVVDNTHQAIGPVSNDNEKIYHVYTDIMQVKDFLTHPRFVLVYNEEDADILWLQGHFKDFRSLQENGKFINQFPNESCLTCKDLLAAVCQSAAPSESNKGDDLLRRGPEWLPVTFNLNLELPLFVDHYVKRKNRGLDNHWICKPWNLARAIDSHVTSNLNYILRLRETGPKVVCKYIEKPVLFDREGIGRVKFDVRYLVLISSAKPLVIHVDKVFWLRFANQPFSLDSFDVYSKHFTVMNYKDSENLKTMHPDEFIALFEKQYPNHRWSDVEVKIFKMLRGVFEAAISDSSPKTLIPCTQSRAFYAVDLMLKWAEDGTDEIVPQVLEMNFGPDCERACRYHPNFFNFIFSLLFLGDANGWPVERIT